jgi:uracil-DNA glycosylase
MGADQNIDWAKTAASALEWWRDAGVDVLVEDTPRDWLADVSKAIAPVVPAPAATASAALPATIEAFLAWRLSADAPEADWGAAKIAASGPVDADVMVLVDCPEREDCDALMSGAVGRLFDRMLAAIGRSRADVHVAALCAARPVAGRMPREIEARLGEIARHHVALVAPKRLLVMGNAASRAILPTDAAGSEENLPVVNHANGKVTEVVTTYHPRFLLEKPAAKAEAWRDLQMLIGGMT